MKYLVFVAIVFLLGCMQPDKKPLHMPQAVKIKPKAKPAKLHAANDAVRVEQFEDTVKLNIMMRDILAYALKNRSKPSYKKSLKLWQFEYDSEAELRYGKLFTSADKYLVIKRKFYGEVIAIDVLKLEGDKFVSAFGQAVMNLTFLDSGIKDLNGDGFDDYFIHWYPSSGCCRRNVYDVYLYQTESRKFADGLQFINPTFSPKEHLVRGVNYGQPGEVGLYKYKWNGLKVETVEYIYPDSTGKKFYLSKARDYTHSGKFLASLPKEYRHIESIDWFKGIY